MENQAYEEDQSRAEEQSTLESCNRNRQSHADTIDDGDSYIPTTTTHIEGHVYEDISTGTEDTTEFSEQISLPDESRSTCEIKNRRSIDFAREAWISEPSSIVCPVVDKLFHHSSTLFSSTGISHESAISTLSKTSDDDPKQDSGKPCNLLSGPNSGNILENVSRENEDSSQDRASTQSDRKPNRRRKKKDCKHCRSKLAGAGSCEKLDELAGSKDAILKENGSNHKDLDVSNFLFRESLLRPQNIKIYPSVNRTSLRDISAKRSCSAGFPISKNGLHLTETFLMNAGNDKMLDGMAENNQNKILGMSKNGTDMRINSIYAQDRWYGKESPIFYTDFKDQNPFQRAYSLPTRTHTPTSQNRVNLRRSVRNDPPPHPARLDKHRRGWTLHLARPLKTSGCSSSLVSLLIVLLILLGVAGVALYIVFEPDKLQIIQQYLKSSAGKLTRQNVTSGEPITSTFSNNELNLTNRITPTSTTVSADAFAMSALLNSDPSFPESTSSPTGEGETEATSRNANATRYCDDCFEGEVCVALVDEQVPICRSPSDREDPTGCAGFCVINKQKCHRLDVDAFRCVEIEHYCLDDEWTCSNTLCIPLDKRCDGHMNCYDHSDEYDCVCNLETHFQCGNETSCLPLERRCDGKIDCWDATDEINCTLGRNLGWSCPLDNEFTCSNGECILKVRFCDGLADCSDRSDEPHGCQGRCNKHEFTCQNGRCITKGMKCNGVDDCGDGTDERHCKDRFT